MLNIWVRPDLSDLTAAEVRYLITLLGERIHEYEAEMGKPSHNTILLTNKLIKIHQGFSRTESQIPLPPAIYPLSEEMLHEARMCNWEQYVDTGICSATEQ